MSAFLRVEGLVKRFDGTVAVDRVSLGLERGELLALLGPSGSGKTTTLRLLAGFETPDEGRVLVEQEDVTAVAPVSRRFGMVFQHYALFPHLDVRGNVAFGLESNGIRGADLQRRVDRALALVDLAGFGARHIGQLSGGQQQRVALRERTRREIRDLIHRVGITTVLVTHEQDEAFELGDRVAVMRGGRLEQVGTPDELYGAPANAFVAGFVGRSSTAAVVVVGPSERGVRIAVDGAEWDVETAPGRPAPPPGPAMMLVRPDALRITPLDPGALPVTITSRRFVGPSAIFTTRTDGGSVLEVVAPPQAVPTGARVGLMPSRRVGGGIHLFPPEGG